MSGPVEVATTGPVTTAGEALALVKSTKPAVSPERRKAKEMAAAGRISWAQQMDEVSAVAVALWCIGADIDPMTEMDVFGNKPSRNGKWYARKLGELMRAGVVEDYVEDPIHNDERLLALGKAGDQWAIEENARRTRERIMHGCPEAATGAWVVRIHVPGIARPILGCQWAGGGTGRKIAGGGVVKTGKEADPIGETFAVESALTRAYGKALRILASHRPEAAAVVRAADDTAEIEQVIESDRAKQAAIAPKGVPQLRAGDPYDAALDAKPVVSEATDPHLDAEREALGGSDAA